MSVGQSSTGAADKLFRGFGIVGSVLGPLLALLFVIGVFGVLDHLWGEGTFLRTRNLQTVAVQTSVVAVAALGMTVIIISGGIDLAAGTALSLSATVLAYCLRENYGIATGVLAGIGTGCLCGLINGALISTLRVVPFIVTLGTMTIYLGAGWLLANDIPIRPQPSQIPNWIPELVQPRPEPDWMLVSPGVWLALGLAAALAIVLRYSVWGRYVFALGSNESTARLCGINVPRIKVSVYAVGGLFVGTAGLYQFARLSSADPGSGQGMELKIIAAVVIGGGSLSGGRGSVLGTLAGAAIMAVIASGCTQLGLRNSIQQVILGVIIIAAVTLDQIRQRRLAK